MTTEANEDSNKPPESVDLSPLKNTQDCGPGCGCNKPSGNGNRKLKVAVCLVVAMAVGAILIFKTTGVTQNAQVSGKGGFANALAPAEPNAPPLARQPGQLGTSLPSIAALNTAAAKLDTVFLVIPAKDNAPASRETGAALAAVERTLHAKGINTGIFFLPTNSPDYPEVAAQVAAPGMLVLTKGAGMGIVSGGVSETNLMQAYVASTRSEGCGTGCGPKGCPTSAAPAAAPSKK